MQTLWGECTWQDIKQAAAEDYLVILPAGGIEQHGPMLPVDVDARIAERNALEGAQHARDRYNLNVLVLPLLPYGQSFHHMHFPGTISLSFETYIAALSDIMRAVSGFGFRSLVVQNGNGGNTDSIRVACAKLAEEFARAGRDTKLYVHPCHDDEYIRAANRELWAGPFKGEHMGMHAAAYETAQVLHDRPHLVKREHLVKAELKRETCPDYFWLTDEITESGAFGDPSLATAEAGARIWDAWAEGIARFLVRISEERGSGRRR